MFLQSLRNRQQTTDAPAQPLYKKSQNIRRAKPPMSPAQHFGQTQTAILSRLDILKRPYRPTPWLFNAHAQLIFLGLQKQRGTMRYDHTEQLRTSDGGTVGLFWMGYQQPATTPTIVMLHTITGTPQSMHGLIADLQQQTGWRVVLCLRRGHADLALTAPTINLLGSTADLQQQLDVIQQRCPDSALYAVGSSAGSGLLVRYLGEAAEHSTFTAAFAYCPGYNTDEAFGRSHPFYSRLMAKKLVQKFITRHAAQLSQLSTLTALQNSKDLAEFQANSYELAGYSSYAAYSAASNPMHVFERIQTPLMVLNAEDDPICHIDNRQPYLKLMQQMPNVSLVTTARGSHCAHYEGWRATSWATRLMAEYFLAVHRDLNSV